MSETASSAVPGQSPSILALGADTASAHAALVEPVQGSHRLIAWESARLAPGAGISPTAALREVSRTLGLRVGRRLWDDGQDSPLLHSPEPALGLHLGQVVAAVDPLPPLRVWIGGLTGHESLAAAQSSLDSTICRPVAVYRFARGGDPARLAAELADTRPDLAVLVGGYDRPGVYDIAGVSAASPILMLCQEVAQALAALPAGNRPALYFAGNRWAAAAALEMWARLPGGTVADALENVAPAPGIHRATGLAVAASRLYWRRCRATSAVQRINRWITAPSEVRSVSWSFAQAVRLWQQVHELPSLHGLYTASPLWIHVAVEERLDGRLDGRLDSLGDLSRLDGQDGVRLRFVRPHTRPPALNGWPPLRLVSGPWPDELWPRPRAHWWDPAGLTPTVANVGQIDPSIAWQVLAQDLLREG